MRKIVTKSIIMAIIILTIFSMVAIFSNKCYAEYSLITERDLDSSTKKEIFEKHYNRCKTCKDIVKVEIPGRTIGEIYEELNKLLKNTDVEKHYQSEIYEYLKKENNSLNAKINNEKEYVEIFKNHYNSCSTCKGIVETEIPGSSIQKIYLALDTTLKNTDVKKHYTSAINQYFEDMGNEPMGDLSEGIDFWNPNGDDSFRYSEFYHKTNVIVSAIRMIGTIISVITLSIIGIKFMSGSVEDKAQYKQTLMPWLVGAIMVFAMTSLPSLIYSIVRG